MKPVRFHPDADAEMVAAAVWYESRQKDLGKRFLSAVQDALNRIEINPELYPLVEGDVRRCLTKTFPFGVLFRIKPDVIAVMAVMHLHRDPDYWKNRRFDRDRDAPHGAPLPAHRIPLSGRSRIRRVGCSRPAAIPGEPGRVMQ